MRIHANMLQQGDKILGLGPIAKVRIFGQQQAVTCSTKMPWPEGQGAIMHAALASMAVADCYRWVATTVRVEINRMVRYFSPDDMVEIVGEAQVLAKAA